MKGFHIRNFTPKDAEQCCKVIDNAAPMMDGLNEAALQFILSKNVPQNRAEEFSDYYTLVCEQDSTVVGLGALDRNEIKRVYVDPSAQRQGIGSAIIKGLEKEAKARNLEFITIEAQPNAVPFYQSLGYQKVKEEVLTIKGAVFDVVHLKKYLS